MAWFGAVYGGSVIKSGTATLVAGTVTIADTSTTASRRVILHTQAPAGTVGALFVSAITAGTSWVIKSTSSSDTSVVQYDVITL